MPHNMSRSKVTYAREVVLVYWELLSSNYTQSIKKKKKERKADTRYLDSTSYQYQIKERVGFLSSCWHCQCTQSIRDTVLVWG